MAGYSINRITQQQKKFIPVVPSLWSSDSLSSQYASLYEKYPSEGSIENVLNIGESISFNTSTNGANGLSSITSTTSADVGDSITAFVWIRTDKPMVVNFTISILYPSGIPSPTPVSTSSRSIIVTSGEWTLLRLYELPVVPDDSYQYPIGFTVSVDDIEDGGPATVNLSHPVIYGTLDFINNNGIVDLMSKLPEFVRDEDANAEPLPYQLIRFIEASAIHEGEIYDLLNNFVYQDISEGKEPTNPLTLSSLVDPSIAIRKYLFWLAQFSGTKIINPQTGFTPWANLPETWDGIDLIDSEDTLQDAAPWSTIQDFNTEPAGLDEFLRWQVSNGFYGVNSGTKKAIIESIERVLIDTKTVGYEVIEPFSWTIRITTLKSETPDASLIDVGDPVLELIELVEPARPLGFKVIHQLA